MPPVVRLGKWLILPPITGKSALVWSLVAIAVPTIIRASLDGVVTGVGFTPYSPFVLLSAVMLCWRYAAVVAIISTVIADALFVGPRFQLIESPTDIFGGIAFLGTSFLIIGLVQAMRTLMKHRGRPIGASNGVIFSQERGKAWASWPGEPYYVQLGQQDEVAEMMKDYLAQLELGERLTKARERLEDAESSRYAR